MTTSLRRPAKTLATVLGLLMAGGLLAAVPAGTAATAPQKCLPAPIPGAECGTVTVPLVRAHPELGRITVAYALIRHRDRAHPAKGTLAVNPGGPGGSTLAYAAAYTELYAPLLSDHDLLLVDPRGVNKSSPADCGLGSQVTSRRGLLLAAEQCGKVLGGKARGYTTAETADDFDAIRAKLGIPKLDLLGQSYGTYLMAVYAQRHPTRVRSIVLSSAYPLKFDMWARANVRAARRSIRILCDRSGRRCDARRLEADLGRLAARLRRAPIRYTDDNGNARLLGAAMLASVVYDSAGNAPRNLGDLPRTVRAALRGNTKPLVATARDLDPYKLSEPGNPAFNAAQGLSVMCNDYPVLWNRKSSLAQRRREFDKRRAALPDKVFRPFGKRAWTEAANDRGDVCLRWPGKGPLQRVTGPFPDVPVLVMSGELDPNTPTEEGRLAARQFRRATVVEVPNVGHVAEREPSGCAAGIQIRFLKTGRVGDTRCMAAIPPVRVA